MESSIAALKFLLNGAIQDGQALERFRRESRADPEIPILKQAKAEYVRL